MPTTSAENHPRKRFEAVAANALCAGVCFGLCLFIARVYFPNDPMLLLGLLAAGNLVGWILGSFLYNRLGSAIWPILFHFVTSVLAVALVFAAGQLWNEYMEITEPRKLSLITLCLSTAAASVRLTTRSYAVAMFGFLLAALNVVLYFLDGDVLILGAVVFCLILGGQALIPRRFTWHAQNTHGSARSRADRPAGDLRL